MSYSREICEYDEDNPNNPILRGSMRHDTLKPQTRTVKNISAFLRSDKIKEISEEQYTKLSNQMDAIYDAYTIVQNEMNNIKNNGKMESTSTFAKSQQQELFCLVNSDEFMWVKKNDDFEKTYEVEVEFFYLMNELQDVFSTYDCNYWFEDLAKLYIEIERTQFTKLKNLFSILALRIHKINNMFEDLM